MCKDLFRSLWKDMWRRNWSREHLSSKFVISSLSLTWTKFKLGEVYDNLIVDDQFNYRFDHLSRYPRR